MGHMPSRKSDGVQQQSAGTRCKSKAPPFAESDSVDGQVPEDEPRRDSPLALFAGLYRRRVGGPLGQDAGKSHDAASLDFMESFQGQA